MRALATHIKQGGVYAMWSNDPPEPAYLDVLVQVFNDVEAKVVTFPNHLQGRNATATIYSGIRG